MKTVHDIAALRVQVAQWKREGKRVGFVPTMGNLHAGHISLISKAKEIADLVVSSIFVNPMQFGEGEDFDSYPRTLADDQLKLEAVGTDLLFAPPVEEMYPKSQEQQTKVTVPGVSDILCGASRPGHFTGVATVVAKLFGMVQPDVAVFGQKDYQQLHIIRQMTEDLSLPIEIVGCPTMREADGLAMSSRNGYLTDSEREMASEIYTTLTEAASLIGEGTGLDMVCESSIKRLEQHGFEPDYFEIRDADTLLEVTTETRKLVLLVAAYLGKPRLIDNLVINPPE